MDNYQIFFNIVELVYIPSSENLHLGLEPRFSSPQAEIVSLTVPFPIQSIKHFELGIFSCVCSRFVNLSVIPLWAAPFSVLRSCLVHCRMFNGVKWQSPLSPSLKPWQPKMSPFLTKCPCRQKSFLVENSSVPTFFSFAVFLFYWIVGAFTLLMVVCFSLYTVKKLVTFFMWLELPVCFFFLTYN